MKYFVFDPYTKERFSFEDIESANVKAQEFKDIASLQEEYRFTVAKEIVNGNDTTWSNADFDNDPEDGIYHVFNTYTGQHEKFESLSLAFERKQEIKTQFMEEMSIAPISEDDLKQPTNVGAQTL